MGRKANAETVFEPAPAGNHAAHCYGVVDHGDQVSEYNGKVSRPAPECSLWFALCYEFQENNAPFTVLSILKMSVNPKIGDRKGENSNYHQAVEALYADR
jgi:hypothetical protein